MSATPGDNLQELVEALKAELESLAGVGHVEIQGAPEVITVWANIQPEADDACTRIARKYRELAGRPVDIRAKW